MNAVYYDTSYLLKLQFMELGSEQVQAHAATQSHIHSSILARPEFASACFRKLREGAANKEDYDVVLAQFQLDVSNHVISLLPLTENVLKRVDTAYAAATVDTYLRAADAIHLATAAEYGFKEIYSNDKHLLNAAKLFGLTGVNVIRS